MATGEKDKPVSRHLILIDAHLTRSFRILQEETPEVTAPRESESDKKHPLQNRYKLKLYYYDFELHLCSLMHVE